MINENINYISVRSVLDDINSMTDNMDWDLDNVLEWIIKGYRTFHLEQKYETCVVFLEVEEHKTKLPSDVKHINQLFYATSDSITEETLDYLRKITGTTEDKPNTKHLTNLESFLGRIYTVNNNFPRFKPLRRNTSNFPVTPCYDEIPNSGCLHTYQIENDCIITTLKEGCIALSYKRFVKGADGLDLIPDNEDLKMALFHFAMYRWWMARSFQKEQASISQVRFHKREFELLRQRAKAQISSPDLDKMENIKNWSQRLVPRSNFYDRGFSNLTNRERIDF